jgi:large subunit ribosomal protein L6
MSKVGRKPIQIADVVVDIKGNEVHYKGKNASGVHILPSFLRAEMVDKALVLSMPDAIHRNKKFWGLHRALLANKIYGAHTLFEKQLKINGLGFKAEVSGLNVKFSLGFSHKIPLELPKAVSLETDKPGQMLTFKSHDKELLGLICDRVRSLRPPEPYKGTGIQLTTEVVRRKAGKKKAS